MTQDDPVVARVRAARRRIIAACGNDPQKIYEWAKRREAELGDRVIGYEQTAAPGSDPTPTEQPRAASKGMT